MSPVATWRATRAAAHSNTAHAKMIEATPTQADIRTPSGRSWSIMLSPEVPAGVRDSTPRSCRGGVSLGAPITTAPRTADHAITIPWATLRNRAPAIANPRVAPSPIDGVSFVSASGMAPPFVAILIDNDNILSSGPHGGRAETPHVTTLYLSPILEHTLGSSSCRTQDALYASKMRSTTKIATMTLLVLSSVLSAQAANGEGDGGRGPIDTAGNEAFVVHEQAPGHISLEWQLGEAAFDELSSEELSGLIEDYVGEGREGDIVSVMSASDVVATPATEVKDLRALPAAAIPSKDSSMTPASTCYHKDMNFVATNAAGGWNDLYRVFYRHHYCSYSNGNVYSTWTSGEGGQSLQTGWNDRGVFTHQHTTQSGDSYAVYGRTFSLFVDGDYTINRNWCGRSTGTGGGAYSWQAGNCSLYG